MCARFSMFGGELPELPLPPDWEPQYNIAPTELVPAVIPVAGGMKPRVMVWGWRPAWAKHMMINARAETVLEKPMFKGSMKSRRCVVAASGYFEWREEQGAKQPYFFHVPDRPTFGIAGLYVTSEETGMYEVVLITTEPNDVAAGFHDRMPAILTGTDINTYLHTADVLEAHSMLMMAFPGELMEIYPVAKHMSNPRWKGADCIRRIA